MAWDPISVCTLFMGKAAVLDWQHINLPGGCDRKTNAATSRRWDGDGSTPQIRLVNLFSAVGTTLIGSKAEF